MLPQVHESFAAPFSISSRRTVVAFPMSVCKTTGNAVDSVGYRWKKTIRLGFSAESRAGGSTRLNMCTLLSLRRNNTRYLARDKCLNRKIPESVGAAAKLGISLAASVSPHKGLPGCPFFPPACLSGARRVALCHSFYGCRKRHRMTLGSLYVAESTFAATNVLYRIN